MIDEPTFFHDWYNSLRRYGNGFPALGTIGGALIVLKQLESDFNLDISAHTADKGTQISGASGPAIKAALAELGEFRPFLREGGRTNRGLVDAISSMLSAISEQRLDRLDAGERNTILKQCRVYLVERVREYHSRQRLIVDYNEEITAWEVICRWLTNAGNMGKAGPVAQYLVGAKLQLRYPDIVVGNESFSTADVQLGREGDFLIGATVFHVTVAPMPGVFEKCSQNLRDGLKPLLLVLDAKVAITRSYCEAEHQGRISVYPIEGFVSQNIDELAAFEPKQLKTKFRELIKCYNARVDATETDKSLLVEIPRQLSDGPSTE